MRRPRRAVAAAVVVLVGAGVVAGVAGPGALDPGRPAEGGNGRAAPAAAPLPVGAALADRRRVPAAPAGPPPAWIATLTGATTWSANPDGPPAGDLAATNPFGTAQVLAVIGAPDGSGRLHVELPVRPNGTTGWIDAAAATLSVTYYRVGVDLSARTLTVTDAGQTVLTTAVAIGAPATPTPPDSTYLWELVRPDDPNGAYGPYIFGLAEYSDAIAVFNGGDAQIGIHGQDEPASIGQAASHGCVRLPNDVIARLAALLPLGTPVTIG